MAKIINNSPQLTKLEFHALFDISTATPSITLTNQSEYVVGADMTNLKWWYEVFTPSQTIIHQGSQATPDETESWASLVVPGTWPLIFGQIEYSGTDYVVTLYAQDAAGNLYSETKSVKICKPNGLDKQANNFGIGKVGVEVKCDQGKVYAMDQSNYGYQGLNGTKVSKVATLHYPVNPANDTRPAPVVKNDMTNAIFLITYSGEDYTVTLTTVMKYDFANNTSVQIKYKYNDMFAVTCNVDMCAIMCEYHKLIQDVKNGKCGDPNGIGNQTKLSIITSLISEALMVKMYPQCATRPLPEIVEEIKQIGGFSCDCYVPGINGGIGSGGIGSSGSGINFELEEGCGDIRITMVENDGTNIKYAISDRKHALALTPEAEAGGFSITSDYDEDTCTETHTIDYVAPEPPEPSAGCPIRYDKQILNDDTGLAWPDCANGEYFLPDGVDVLGPDRLTVIGVARNVHELTALMSGDLVGPSYQGWSYWGIAIPRSNCSVGFLCADHLDTPAPPIYVRKHVVVNPPCIGQTKTFEKPYKDYNPPYDDLLTDPFASGSKDCWVSYNSGTTKISLGNIATLADLLTALAAEGSKPAGVSYAAGSTGDKIKVLMFDTDCAQIDTVFIYISVGTTLTEGDLVIGARTTYAGAAGTLDMKALNVTNDTYLGRICNGLSGLIPWHVVRFGNRLWSASSSTGEANAFDMTNPLSPSYIASAAIPGVNTTSNPVAYSGLPQYGGTVASQWDAYFVTDYNDLTTDSFVLESTSGTLSRIDLSAAPASAFTSMFQSTKLRGRCPRVLVQGFLFFSNDGSRSAQTGLAQGAPANCLVAYNISAGSASGIGLISDLIPGDSPLAISWQATAGCMWIVMKSGSIVKFTYPGGVTTIYNGVINMGGSGIFTDLVNSTLVGTKLYVSAKGHGTWIVDLATIGPNSGVPFQAMTVPNNKHYTFKHIPGKTYGILCYGGSGGPGGLAKYLLDGTFVKQMPLDSGEIFNVEHFTHPGGANGYC